jgi:hypothetical protein
VVSLQHDGQYNRTDREAKCVHRHSTSESPWQRDWHPVHAVHPIATPPIPVAAPGDRYLRTFQQEA